MGLFSFLKSIPNPSTFISSLKSIQNQNYFFVSTRNFILKIFSNCDALDTNRQALCYGPWFSKYYTFYLCPLSNLNIYHRIITKLDIIVNRHKILVKFWYPAKSHWPFLSYGPWINLTLTFYCCLLFNLNIFQRIVSKLAQKYSKALNLSQVCCPANSHWELWFYSPSISHNLLSALLLKQLAVWALSDLVSFTWLLPIAWRCFMHNT